MVRGVFDEIGLYDTIIGGSGTKQLWLEVNMEFLAAALEV